MNQSRVDTSSSADELLGGRYALEASIGQGRSTVYRAVDTRLRREVAVKRVRLVSDDEDRVHVRIRALREARAAARLNHPRVVTVYDIVEDDDALWLVMELIEAPSLAQLVIGSGPLEHDRAARIGMDVLGALAAAHAAGVVHRDVKPANVLVTETDRAKLADFGVATIRDHTRVTATGRVVGSPAYMAPEQALGQEVGPAADLWALGATLYFAVEGTPPFGGDSALATLSAVVHSSPRPPQRPGTLSSLLAELLSKDPTRRPPAPEVGVALAGAAERDHGPAATDVGWSWPASHATRRAPEPDVAPPPDLGSQPTASTAWFPPPTPPPTHRPPEDLPVPTPSPSGDVVETQEAGEAAEAAKAAPSPPPAPAPPTATPATAEAAETAAIAEAVEFAEADAASEPASSTPSAPDPPTTSPAAAEIAETAETAAIAEAVEGGGVDGRAGAGEVRRRGSSQRRLVQVAALVALVVVLAMASWAVFRHGDADRDDGGPAGVAQSTDEGNGNGNGREGRGNTTDSTAADDETGSSPATTGEPAADEPAADQRGGPSDGSEGSAVEVPDDWVSYEHPEGAYSIRYPPGWQVVPASGPRIDFRDPATGTYLRVDWTTEPQPDPVADWEQQATHFAARHTGYEQIRIEPYQYRDYNAALWEFRYQGGSSRLHVGNLGFVTADGDRAYALYFQTSDGRWADSQTLFAQFREAFQPA